LKRAIIRKGDGLFAFQEDDMGSGSTGDDDATKESAERPAMECAPSADAERESGRGRIEPAEHDDRMGEEPGYGYGV
jgi:hypothetical protein